MELQIQEKEVIEGLSNMFKASAGLEGPASGAVQPSRNIENQQSQQQSPKQAGVQEDHDQSQYQSADTPIAAAAANDDALPSIPVMRTHADRIAFLKQLKADAYGFFNDEDTPSWEEIQQAQPEMQHLLTDTQDPEIRDMEIQLLRQQAGVKVREQFKKFLCNAGAALRDSVIDQLVANGTPDEVELAKCVAQLNSFSLMAEGIWPDGEVAGGDMEGADDGMFEADGAQDRADKDGE